MKGGRSVAASSPRYFRPAFHFHSACRTVENASSIATSSSSERLSSVTQHSRPLVALTRLDMVRFFAIARRLPAPTPSIVRC